jgi:hypothetical protein
MRCEYVSEATGVRTPLVCDDALLRRMRLALRVRHSALLPPERFECDHEAAAHMQHLGLSDPDAQLEAVVHDKEPEFPMMMKGREIRVREDWHALPE